MSDYQSNNRDEWKLARQENRDHAASRNLALCRKMIAEIPDIKPVEQPCPGKCEHFKRSKLFEHTLECKKCGNMIEHPVISKQLIDM